MNKNYFRATLCIQKRKSFNENLGHINISLLCCMAAAAAYETTYKIDFFVREQKSQGISFICSFAWKRGKDNFSFIFSYKN